jgi:hypothetical protein
MTRRLTDLRCKKFLEVSNCIVRAAMSHCVNRASQRVEQTNLQARSAHCTKRYLLALDAYFLPQSVVANDFNHVGRLKQTVQNGQIILFEKEI